MTVPQRLVDSRPRLSAFLDGQTYRSKPQFTVLPETSQVEAADSLFDSLTVRLPDPPSDVLRRLRHGVEYR
jgi:hypothetical protein